MPIVEKEASDPDAEVPKVRRKPPKKKVKRKVLYKKRKRRRGRTTKSDKIVENDFRVYLVNIRGASSGKS